MIEEYLSSVGVAIVVTLLVEVLKRAGLIEDGMAAKWAGAINAVAYAGFMVSGIYGFDPMGSTPQMVIAILAEVLRIAVSVLGSPLFYKALIWVGILDKMPERAYG